MTLSVFSSCNGQTAKFDPNFTLGVIETTQKENKSLIHFYDENLSKINTMKFPLGSMGDRFFFPIVYGDSVYTIPQGIGNQKEKTIVFSLNLKTGEDKQYDLEIVGMNSLAVSKEYVFGVHDLNFTSTIVRCNKKNNETQELKIPKFFIEKMIVADDYLFAIGNYNDENGYYSVLYQINIATMQIEKTFDLKAYGYSFNGMVLDGNTIYWSNTYKASADGKSELENNTVTMFHIDTQTFETIELQEEYPSQLIVQDRKLFILHSDFVMGEGRHITIYDMDTKEQEIITFDHDLLEFRLDDDMMYVVNWREDAYCVYQYKMKGTDLTLINEMEPITIHDDRHFVGGIFTANE